ncbi:sugar transferase, partial [Bifidobacterium pullorum subsp. saeculare]|nr:sugar transferase [Bifidobacterium pullorum subsp. saeculare]
MRAHAAEAEGYDSEVVAAAERLSRRYAYRFVKRAFDIVFSLAVILVALVPSALLCLAIRLETPGCPLYGQKRVGRIGPDGKPREFIMWKFRSMVK